MRFLILAALLGALLTAISAWGMYHDGPPDQALIWAWPALIGLAALVLSVAMMAARWLVRQLP